MSKPYMSLAFVFAAGALLAGCNRGSFSATSIANGGITVNGEEVTLHGTGDTEATVDAAGNLVVDGKPITIDATQRQLLQQYYRSARAVREHGIATGKAGAAVALQSVKSAATHVVGGDGEHADASLDAATTRVDDEASKICLDLRQIKGAQDRLAAGLAAFKPFAGILEDEGDCSRRTLTWHDASHTITLKSGNDDGVQVASTQPASVWGLQQGDEILAVDGQPVGDVDELVKHLSASKPSAVRVRLRRGGAEQEVTIAASDYADIANP